MKINKVTLENYRCFENYQIVFGSKSTVLIGKNGTGKTNLIKALIHGWSFIFAKKSKKFKKSLSDSNNGKVKGLGLWDTRFDNIDRSFTFPISNSFEGDFYGDLIQWSMVKKNHPGGLHTTYYDTALNKILSYFNNDIGNAPLPVLAFFSDSYPHIKSNRPRDIDKTIQADVLPRDVGYYDWDEETNCIELWQIRFIKAYNEINDIRNDQRAIEDLIESLKSPFNNKQGSDFESENLYQREKVLRGKLEDLKKQLVQNDFQNELNFVRERILTFTAPLRNDLAFINSEFQIKHITVTRPDRKLSYIEFLFANDSTMFFDHLPQGYKRLFSMVLDIAYRSYILNQSQEPEGIVFIDEIELHLHPSLQQEVLQRFTLTFPKMQFIVSTHSPLVISNLVVDNKENVIVKLESNGELYSNKEVGNIYGIDYTTSLMDVMETSYRSSDIDNLIDSYVILTIKERKQDAQKIWDEIFQLVGDNSRIREEIERKIKENC